MNHQQHWPADPDNQEQELNHAAAYCTRYAYGWVPDTPTCPRSLQQAQFYARALAGQGLDTQCYSHTSAIPSTTYQTPHIGAGTSSKTFPGVAASLPFQYSGHGGLRGQSRGSLEEPTGHYNLHSNPNMTASDGIQMREPESPDQPFVMQNAYSSDCSCVLCMDTSDWSFMAQNTTQRIDDYTRTAGSGLSHLAPRGQTYAFSRDASQNSYCTESQDGRDYEQLPFGYAYASAVSNLDTSPQVSMYAFPSNSPGDLSTSLEMPGLHSQDGGIAETDYSCANYPIHDASNARVEDEAGGEGEGDEERVQDIIEVEEEEEEEEEDENGHSSEDGMSSPESSTNSDEPNPRNRESDGAFLCRLVHCRSKARFRRFADLQRHHNTVHKSSNTRMYDCPRRKCVRKGARGFTRRDHLTEHLRAYHDERIPKRRKGKPKA